MESLWPDDIANLEQIKSPVSILKEQASSLGKMTKNILVGEIYPVPVDQPYACYKFNILAPSLRNYRYSLFTIMYRITNIYPLAVDPDTEIYEELEPLHDKMGPINIENETELIDTLKKIFHSDKVKQILKSLMAEIDAVSSKSR